MSHSRIWGILAHATLASESIAKPQLFTQQQLHDELMHQFLLEVSTQQILKGKDSSDYCHSYSRVDLNFTCKNNSVYKVHIDRIPIENLSLQHLPNTVELLRVYRAEQRYSVETRLLPRNAINIELGANHLYGTIDLRTLPHKLEAFGIGSNDFVGPVILTMLPPKLRTLDLGWNKIKQKCVFYGNLPESLVYIGFVGGNSINAIRSADAKACDPKIFSVNETTVIY